MAGCAPGSTHAGVGPPFCGDPPPPPLLALSGPGAGEETPSVRLGETPSERLGGLWAPRGYERPRPREGAGHGPQPRRRGGGARPGAPVGV